MYQNFLGWVKNNGKLKDISGRCCNLKPTIETILHLLIKQLTPWRGAILHDLSYSNGQQIFRSFIDPVRSLSYTEESGPYPESYYLSSHPHNVLFKINFKVVFQSKLKI
jgi:hypothetical protein